MKDYELQIAVKNAPLLNLMRENGYETAADLSRACGISQKYIGDILNLKKPLFTKRGEVNIHAQKIADFFRVMPDMLYPENHHFEGLDKNKASVQIEAEQMFALTHIVETDPEALLEHQQMIDVTTDVLDSLSSKEKDVLHKRFQEEMTYQQIASFYNVSNAWIQQIEQRAMRKLRHPNRSEELRQFIHG